ncbi:unnamed protein product [Rhizopus stolonifer]
MGANCCKEDPVDLSTEVELSHFTLLRSVGRGSFGKVRVVEHKGTKELYALKYINKTKCLQMKAAENVISERQLLELIDHPLIVNLRYAFQDDENLFMVLDLMLGGDLRFRLEKSCLPEHHVQFYSAQVALALNYLHQKNIVHRDIKPDNILLDQRGHAHLTDFNVALKLEPDQSFTSLAGSMAYIAPEMLKKQGYDSFVDWWALGISIYELLYGKRPFSGKSNDILKTSILQDPIDFPSSPKISQDAIHLIRGLLERNVQDRFGFQEIRNHPWFKKVSWDHLVSKTIEAPFIPDENKSNFDPTHEIEEALLDSHPLQTKKAKKSMSHSDLMTDEKSLFERFLIYDYSIY